MKKIIYIILTFSFLVSCQTETAKNEKSDKTEIVKSNDSLGSKTDSLTTENRTESNTIYIKDSSDYSTRFLKEMAKSGMSNVSLIDSFMIFGQTDTVTFPEVPRVGRRTILTAKKDHLAIALTVERINQTTIDYKIEMVEFGNAGYTYEGQADLYHRFHLGAEVDENDMTGGAYLSYEFSDLSDTCKTVIRLGEDEHYLLGKIIKNCNGKIRDIELDNFRMLIEK
ncbi:MAG: hypothetical protein COA32_08965 [Fluviicola sp.]|nr:MAG: hypothetical protein COA32_08965 [Fluviicola sp.]